MNYIKYFCYRESLWMYQEIGAKANEGQTPASEVQISCYTGKAEQGLRGATIVSNRQKTC